MCAFYPCAGKRLDREISYTEINLITDCYEKNDPTELRANHTMTFMHLWNDTITCFKRFIDINLHPEGGDFIVRLKPDFQKGSLCQNCSDIYDKMRNYFWDEVIPTTDKHTLNGVCYDIRDAVSI